MNGRRGGGVPTLEPKTPGTQPAPTPAVPTPVADVTDNVEREQHVSIEHVPVTYPHEDGCCAK